jgi:hypothetical protein
MKIADTAFPAAGANRWVLSGRERCEPKQLLGCFAAARVDDLFPQEPEEYIGVRLADRNALQLDHLPVTSTGSLLGIVGAILKLSKYQLKT